MLARVDSNETSRDTMLPLLSPVDINDDNDDVFVNDADMDQLLLLNTTNWNDSFREFLLGEVDNSTTSSEATTSRRRYTVEHVILSSIVVSVILLAIVVGNGLVIIAIAVDQNLRGLQNWFIASLAVSDLLVGLFVMPLSLANELMGYWAFGDVICELWLSTDVLLCTASILNLCLISLDRYWSITRALNYIQQRTRRRAVCMISTVWVLSMLICLPPLLGWKRPQRLSQDGQTLCVLSEEIGYVVYSSVGSFYLPLVVMVLVYVKIYIAARDRARRNLKNKRRKQQQQPTEVTAMSNTIVNYSAVDSRNSGGSSSVGLRRKELRTTFSADAHEECDGKVAPRTAEVADGEDVVVINYKWRGDENQSFNIENDNSVYCIKNNNDNYIDDDNNGNELIEQNLRLLPHGDTLSKHIVLKEEEEEETEEPDEPGDDETFLNSPEVGINDVTLYRRRSEQYNPDFGTDTSNAGCATNPELRNLTFDVTGTAPQHVTSRDQTSSGQQLQGSETTRSRNGDDAADSTDCEIIANSRTNPNRNVNGDDPEGRSYRRNDDVRNIPVGHLNEGIKLDSSCDQIVDASKYEIRNCRDGSMDLILEAVIDKSTSSNDAGRCSKPGLVARDGAHKTLTAPASDPETARRRLARSRERRATVVLGIVMASFIGCWLPFFAIYPLSLVLELHVPDQVFAVIFWLGYCNSALNPIIYTIFNREFRLAFGSLVFGRRWAARGQQRR